MEEQRNYGAEIDALRRELDELKELLGTKTGPEDFSGGDLVGHVQKNPGMHPDPHIMALMDECENICGNKNLTGCITYLGVFASGGNQSSWIRKSMDTDELLSIGLSGTAEIMLSCIGSQERLNILLTLLKQPMSVAELVEKLHLTSTGQAYHHLKPLIAADLVMEDSRVKGRYEINPPRVQGLIMILAGIADLL